MSPPSAVEVDLRGDSDTSSVPVPNPLTVDGVATWRSKTAKVPSTVAPAVHSDMFKSPVREAAVWDVVETAVTDWLVVSRIAIRSRRPSGGIVRTPTGDWFIGRVLIVADRLSLESKSRKVRMVDGYMRVDSAEGY